MKAKVKVTVKAENVHVYAHAERRERLEEALYRLSNMRDRLWLFDKLTIPVRYDEPGQRYGKYDVTPNELLRLYAGETPEMLKTLDEVMELLDGECTIKM